MEGRTENFTPPWDNFTPGDNFAPGGQSLPLWGSEAGLPDGIFSNQKFQFGLIVEGLAMEDVGLCYDHLILFTAI
jgi:hypothetical protein